LIKYLVCKLKFNICRRCWSDGRGLLRSTRFEIGKLVRYFWPSSHTVWS